MKLADTGFFAMDSRLEVHFTALLQQNHLLEIKESYLGKLKMKNQVLNFPLNFHPSFDRKHWILWVRHSVRSCERFRALWKKGGMFPGRITWPRQVRAATTPRPRHRLLLGDCRRQEVTSSPSCVLITKGLGCKGNHWQKASCSESSWWEPQLGWGREEVGTHHFCLFFFFLLQF